MTSPARESKKAPPPSRPIFEPPNDVPVATNPKAISFQQVTVANSMWNYCVGLKEPTPIPPELREHYGEKERPGYNAWRYFLRWHQREPLMPSGLLGPVTLGTTENS
jgi:hypothetical protein